MNLTDPEIVEAHESGEDVEIKKLGILIDPEKHVWRITDSERWLTDLKVHHALSCDWEVKRKPMTIQEAVRASSNHAAYRPGCPPAFLFDRSDEYSGVYGLTRDDILATDWAPWEL